MYIYICKYAVYIYICIKKKDIDIYVDVDIDMNNISNPTILGMWLEPESYSVRTGLDRQDIINMTCDPTI